MAKTSILTILIQLAKSGNADKETIKGLAQLKYNVGQAMGAFAALAGVAYTVDKALDSTVGVMVNYAAQVREMNRLTGSGTEETSRLIQMADDLTISYESLQKSLWFASKNGVEVNVESMARLADEYVSLNDPMARADFLAKNFGKSGFEMAKMLEQGGAAVRDMAESIEGSLVLTERAVIQARQYEVALDNWQDAIQATKVAIGSALLPALTDLIDGQSQYQQALQDVAREQGLNYQGMNRVSASNEEFADSLVVQAAAFVQAENYGRAWERALLGITDAQSQAAASADEMATSNEDMLGLILNMQGEFDAYNEDLAGLTEKMAGLKEEQTLYLEGGAKYQELQGQIEATGAAIDELTAKHEESSKRIAFSMLQQKMSSDGLTDAEFENLLLIGQQWGILTEETVTAAGQMTASVTQLARKLADSRHETNLLHKQMSKLMELSGASVDFFVNIHTRGGIPKGLDVIGTNNVNPNIVTAPGSQVYYAEGGQLGNGWAMVGEEGFEIISPTGYVFPHDVSQQLIAAGVMPGAQLAAGGYWEGETSGSASSVKSVKVAKGKEYKDFTFATRVRQDRGELSGGGGSSVAAAEAAVSEAVAPLAGATAEAIGSAQVTQQITVSALEQLQNSTTQGNQILQEINANLQRNNVTTKNAVVAAVQQVMG